MKQLVRDDSHFYDLLTICICSNKIWVILYSYYFVMEMEAVY